MMYESKGSGAIIDPAEWFLKMVETSNFNAIDIILYSAQFVKEYLKKLDKTVCKIKRGKLTE